MAVTRTITIGSELPFEHMDDYSFKAMVEDVNYTEIPVES